MARRAMDFCSLRGGALVGNEQQGFLTRAYSLNALAAITYPNEFTRIRPGPLMQRRLPAVLVVDDEATCANVVSLTLVRLGLDVDTAESVSAARTLLSRNAYALCLTDMRLPDGTGLDLVRHVSASAGPPIAVITATAALKMQSPL